MGIGETISFITSAFVFIIVLSVLVLIHEFGHFIMGKRSSVGVLEFALGLPFTKPLWSKRLKNGMAISLYPLLFGGFVKLLGEEGPSQADSRQRTAVRGGMFYKAPVWTRIGIVVAGVVMNFVLAVAAFYLLISLSNFRILIPKFAESSFLSPSSSVVVISDVQKDTPAAKTGIKINDVVLEVDGKSDFTLKEFQSYVRGHLGQPLRLTVSDLSLEKEKVVEIIPRVNPPKGQGPLGVGIGEAYMLSYSTGVEKMTSGLSYSADMLVYNLHVLGGMVLSAAKTGDTTEIGNNVSGPIGIFSIIDQIMKLELKERILSLVNILGILSLSLAFMNILPIPAMDGGRLAFLLVEALTGKRFSPERENLINQIGMAGLLALIFLISYNDIIKLIGR